MNRNRTLTSSVFALAVCAGFLIATGQQAKATTVPWAGQTWDNNSFSNDLGVVGGNLKVGPNLAATFMIGPIQFYEGAGHYDTSGAFRSSPFQGIQATINDLGDPTQEGWGLLIEREGAGTMADPYWSINIGRFIHIPSDPNFPLTYYLDIQRYDGVHVFSDRYLQAIPNAVTPGQHTVSLELSGGALGFGFDGTVVHTETGLRDGVSYVPDYLGDVYLRGWALSNSESWTWTGYEEFTAPVPEPASIALLGLGLAGLAALRRRRK